MYIAATCIIPRLPLCYFFAFLSPFVVFFVIIKLRVVRVQSLFDAAAFLFIIWSNQTEHMYVYIEVGSEPVGYHTKAVSNS